MDLIYADSLSKRLSVHVHIFGEGSERIGVGDIEFTCDICSSKGRISESIYDHKVSKLRVALHDLSAYSSIDELKGEACYLLPGGSGQDYTLGGDITLYDMMIREIMVSLPICL